MSQAEKKRRSGGILTRLAGTLAAVAFGLVFSFGLSPILPLHIAGSVGPAAFQGLNVINNEPFAFSCKFPSFRAGVRSAELVLCVVGAKDSPVPVPGASLTALGSERRNDQQ